MLSSDSEGTCVHYLDPAHYCWDHKTFGGIVFPTSRRVVRRDPETDRVVLEGPTSFLLDYCDVEER